MGLLPFSLVWPCHPTVAELHRINAPEPAPKGPQPCLSGVWTHSPSPGHEQPLPEVWTHSWSPGHPSVAAPHPCLAQDHPHLPFWGARSPRIRNGKGTRGHLGQGQGELVCFRSLLRSQHPHSGGSSRKDQGRNRVPLSVHVPAWPQPSLRATSWGPREPSTGKRHTRDRGTHQDSCLKHTDTRVTMPATHTRTDRSDTHDCGTCQDWWMKRAHT